MYRQKTAAWHGVGNVWGWQTEVGELGVPLCVSHLPSPVSCLSPLIFVSCPLSLVFFLSSHISHHYSTFPSPVSCLSPHVYCLSSLISLNALVSLVSYYSSLSSPVPFSLSHLPSLVFCLTRLSVLIFHLLDSVLLSRLTPPQTRIPSSSFSHWNTINRWKGGEELDHKEVWRLTARMGEIVCQEIWVEDDHQKG